MPKHTLTFSAILLAATPAYAQNDPGSIERTIPRFEEKPAAGQPAISAPEVAAPTGGRIAGTFILGAVNIEGATAFTSEELAQDFEPFLASEVGQAELDRIAANITARYRRAGFFLSYAMVPEQSVQSGIVTIRIVEGYVDEVHVEGGARSEAAAAKVAASLSADRPLRTATIERALGLIRDLPGFIVSDVRISRSPQDPARHQLTLVLGSDRARAMAYTDNRGTIDGARLRGYSSVSLHSLAVPGDQLQLDLFAIPSDRFRFFYGQAKASLPIGMDGLRLSVAASHGSSFQRLDGPNQRGRLGQWVADLAYPFAKSRAWTLVGHASLGDLRTREKRDGAAIQRDRLQVARAWLEFARVAAIRLDGRVGIAQGLDLGSSTEKGDPLASRPGADGTFTRFNADLLLTAPLDERWTLRVDSSAQYATRPLLAPEEFALGGSRIGRAFDFNELTGDHGFGAMLELGYRLGDVGKAARQVELFAFLDGGATFRRRASPGLPDEQWLAGTGAGARLSMFGLYWTGEAGIPLARSDRDRSPRAFFSATKAF